MRLPFVDREAEVRELDRAARHGGLLVVYGRRRVGKTRLLRRWLRSRDGLYSQAIEASPGLQLDQVLQDLRGGLETRFVPRTWPDLLEILALQRRRWILCLDEFPYLAAADPSLPSRLQKWLDPSLPAGCLLILAGSSTRMMHDLYLHFAAALSHRAHKLLRVQPLDYESFCRARHLDMAADASFEKFACVGGIPKYWEFVEARQDVVALAESLYFDLAPYMEQEPHRILRDEGVVGLQALAVLEAVGRGAERPSEIAARLGTAQTSMSRLLRQLLDASILQRELPFGESLRSTRRVRFAIRDPSLRFWFHVFSPHRSLWRTYVVAEKRKLIHDHAATVFEDFCRARFPGARRHWEADLELDLVAPDPTDHRRLVVAEVEWSRLSAAKRRKTIRQLEEKWSHCSLRARHPRVRFELLDATSLAG